MAPPSPPAPRIAVLTSSTRLKDAHPRLWAGARAQVVVVGCTGTGFARPAASSALGLEGWPRRGTFAHRLVLILLRRWSRRMAAAWSVEAARRVGRLAREGAVVILDGEHLGHYATVSGECWLVPSGAASRRESAVAAGIAQVLDPLTLSGDRPVVERLSAARGGRLDAT